jgi:hypothetical protein
MHWKKSEVVVLFVFFLKGFQLRLRQIVSANNERCNPTASQQPQIEIIDVNTQYTITQHNVH